jgi:lipopolysaccharide transport system ATP-binding protein
MGIYTFSGKRVNHLQRGKCYYFKYQVKFNKTVTSVHFGMMIKSTSGLDLGGAISAPIYQRFPAIKNYQYFSGL